MSSIPADQVFNPHTVFNGNDIVLAVDHAPVYVSMVIYWLPT